MKWKLKVCLAAPPALCLLAIAISALLIRVTAADRTYSDTSLIPYRKVGVVLGCSKILANGRNNLFFAYRINAAIELFRSGKIDYIIVSGDNGNVAYDESTDMKRALVEAGVPAERVYCDFAGFRTLDSMVRAKQIFGQTQITVISQEFHNQRAIYIARREGVDAIGFNAREVDSFNSCRTKLRESLARVKTVLDVCVLGTRPKFGGKSITIGSLTPQEP